MQVIGLSIIMLIQQVLTILTILLLADKRWRVTTSFIVVVEPSGMVSAYHLKEYDDMMTGLVLLW